jgi:C-8 sterol isomerase
MSASGCGCRYFSLWNSSLLAVFLALFSALYSFLDARLDQFYIFYPKHLHDLSQYTIKTYREDTGSIINFIVAELQEKISEKYLSTEEEWVFNNASGAIGTMYSVYHSR